MKKNKFTAIIMLVIASMIASIVPVWAATVVDSTMPVSLNMLTTPTSTTYNYHPYLYGTVGSDWSIGTTLKSYGRRIGPTRGYAELDYDDIAEGYDFAAYGIKYDDGSEVDISKVANAMVTIDIHETTDSTVSTDDLYYAIMTKGTDGIDFAGVPVTSLEAATIPISDFKFLCSTGTGTSINLAKFCGLGFVRMAYTGDGEAPASEGRIFTSKLEVAGLNAIDDLDAKIVQGKPVISFTAPTLEGLGYTLEIVGDDSSERSIALTADDFALSDGIYTWTDEAAEHGVTYIYKVILEHGETGLSSESNVAVAEVPEDIGGDAIPEDGYDAMVIELPARNFRWYIGKPNPWVDVVIGGRKGDTINAADTYPALGGSDNVVSVDLGYDNLLTEDNVMSGENIGDFFAAGLMADQALMGGIDGTTHSSANISHVEETGTAVFRVYVEESVELTNAYFAIGQRWLKGLTGDDIISYNFAGVPMGDYITEEDKGKVVTVSIPLTDFKVGAKQNSFHKSWYHYAWMGTAPTEAISVDLRYFGFMGLIRDCSKDNKPETSGKIYISDMGIYDVKPVTNLEIVESSESRIMLEWDHSETLVEKYNVYREADGEKELLGSTDLNRFLDTNGGQGFELYKRYNYYVEAVDSRGFTSTDATVSVRMTAIDPPEDVTVEGTYSQAGEYSVVITWQPPLFGDPAGYRVYRNGELCGEVDASKTSYTDEDVESGEEYTYSLVSLDSNGNESNSTEEFSVIGACYGDFKYTIENDEATIIGYLGTQSQDVIIPDEIMGFSVTAFSNDVFMKNEYITGVTIPNGVTEIGEEAFAYCSNLAKVSIPSSVTTIGVAAFGSCTSLAEINIPESVTQIGNNAFGGCTALTEIIIPNGVTTIGEGLFAGCTSLKKVTIPSGVNEIRGYAFYNCTSLEEVNIPSSVTTIGEGAFAYCSSFDEVTIPSSVTAIEDYTFYDCTGLVDVTIPSSVTTIGVSAFYECSGLIEVTIPSSVTTIGDFAFYGCTGLIDVTIPSSVTTIGIAAFYECSSLIEVTIPSSVTTIGDHAFNRCSSLVDITIPDGVDKIGIYTFYSCTSLDSVTIPDGVTSIGEGAFGECTSLEEVTIPSSVTSIGSSAFNGCTSIKEVTIPDSVTTIGGYAFNGCTGLEKIIIPDSVITIEYEAFANCTSLEEVAIGSGVTSISYSTFDGCTSLAEINVDADNLKYSSVDGVVYDKDKKTLIMCPKGKSGTYSIFDGVTTIKYDAFEGCTGLEEVTIPSSVTTIGNNAFKGCTGLTSVTIPNSVTEISYCAFTSCTGLTSVIIPDGITTIRSSTFENCTSLEKVTISDSVTAIEDYAFDRCSSLKEVIIPNGVTAISFSTFENCTSLTSVTIPRSVYVVYNNAFANCESLETVYFNGNIDQLAGIHILDGNDSFKNARKICFYYVTVQNEDGNIIDRVKVEAEKTVDLSEIEDNLGENTLFYTDKECTVEFDESMTITENTTLYAAIQNGIVANVSDDKKNITVLPVGADRGDMVIVALYNGTRLLNAQTAIFSGERLPFETVSDYTSAKVMVWDSFAGMMPELDSKVIE